MICGHQTDCEQLQKDITALSAWVKKNGRWNALVISPKQHIWEKHMPLCIAVLWPILHLLLDNQHLRMCAGELEQ